MILCYNLCILFLEVLDMTLTIGDLDSLTLGELNHVTLGELDTLTFDELVCICRQRLSELEKNPDRKVTLSKKSAEIICKITSKLSEHLTVENLTANGIINIIYRLLDIEINKVAQAYPGDTELLKQILDILYEIIS